MLYSIIMIDLVTLMKTCVENSDFLREFSTNRDQDSALFLFEAQAKDDEVDEDGDVISRAETQFYLENFIKSMWAILSYWQQIIDLRIILKNCEQVKSFIFTYWTLFCELVLYWLFLIFDSSETGNLQTFIEEFQSA